MTIDQGVVLVELLLLGSAVFFIVGGSHRCSLLLREAATMLRSDGDLITALVGEVETLASANARLQLENERLRDALELALSEVYDPDVHDEVFRRAHGIADE